MATEAAATKYWWFTPRKARAARFGRYTGNVEILATLSDGRKLVTQEDQRWSAFPDELTAHNLHGSPDNYSFDNNGKPKV